MKHYEMQIRLKDTDNIWKWKSIKPTGGQPYRYETRAEAENMINICYPGIENADIRRIVEVQ